jgi:hypothetical protein
MYWFHLLRAICETELQIANGVYRHAGATHSRFAAGGVALAKLRVYSQNASIPTLRRATLGLDANGGAVPNTTQRRGLNHCLARGAKSDQL